MIAADTFYVLDFDRCLGNERLYELLDEVIADMVDFDVFQAARSRVEASGGSFNLFRWLERNTETSDNFFNEFSLRYLRLAKKQGANFYLSAGATELLEYFTSNGIYHMIMTYGGREYQTLKLQAAGLDGVPHKIVASKEKSSYIRNWWRESEGCFVVPGVWRQKFKTICLIDDKAAAFKNLPIQATGYFVGDETARLPSQSGSVPMHVQSRSSLIEVLADIQGGK